MCSVLLCSLYKPLTASLFYFFFLHLELPDRSQYLPGSNTSTLLHRLGQTTASFLTKAHRSLLEAGYKGVPVVKRQGGFWSGICFKFYIHPKPCCILEKGSNYDWLS